MEFEHNNFASKGVAGAGLGLGIAGTALSLLNGGLGMAQPMPMQGVNSFETYKDTQKEINDLRLAICQLNSAVAVNTSNLSALSDSYDSLTKTYIPNSNIVTVTTATTTAG